MTIKEAEQILGVPRATIRFYEKQNLIHPNRRGNSYRDYSKEDIAALKKIIIFRKLGLSVQEIKDLSDDSVLLQEAIEKNIGALQKQVEELNGALTICRRMQSRRESWESFQVELYWDEIYGEEKKGNRFFSIAGDFLRYEAEGIALGLRVEDEKHQFRHSRGNVFVKVVLFTLASGLITFLLENCRGGGFLKGIFAPVVFLALLTIFEVPSFICKDRYPGVKKWLDKIGFLAAVIGMAWYLSGFFRNVWVDVLSVVLEGGDGCVEVLAASGLMLWGFIQYFCERRLIFDRRHVTGFSGFTTLMSAGALIGIVLYRNVSVEAGIACVIVLIMIYQTINHFVEEKQYGPRERFEKPQ